MRPSDGRWSDHNTPLTDEERQARFVLELLTGDPVRAGLDAPDWNLLARLAKQHAVLARVADRLEALGVPAPQAFVAAADAERARARGAVEVLGHVEAAGTRHGIAWMAPKAVQRYPDVGDDLDLLVFAPEGVDRLLLEDLPAARERPTLAHRVAGSTVYTMTGAVAPGLVLDLHHGSVGTAGQHAAFAHTLARNGRRALLEGTELRVPSPEDQLVLQALEKVAGRRSFHLCDVLQTIAILRSPRLDWDYVLATARAHWGQDGLGCYLHYVDQIHARLVGGELLAPERRRALNLHGWGHAHLREAGFCFPAVRVTCRLHGRQLAGAVGGGDWNAALRLALWPLAAVGSRLGRLAQRERRERRGVDVGESGPHRASRFAGAEARAP